MRIIILRSRLSFWGWGFLLRVELVLGLGEGDWVGLVWEWNGMGWVEGRRWEWERMGRHGMGWFWEIEVLYIEGKYIMIVSKGLHHGIDRKGVLYEKEIFERWERFSIVG